MALLLKWCTLAVRAMYFPFPLLGAAVQKDAATERYYLSENVLLNWNKPEKIYIVLCTYRASELFAKVSLPCWVELVRKAQTALYTVSLITILTQLLFQFLFILLHYVVFKVILVKLIKYENYNWIINIKIYILA